MNSFFVFFKTIFTSSAKHKNLSRPKYNCRMWYKTSFFSDTREERYMKKKYSIQ